MAEPEFRRDDDGMLDELIVHRPKLVHFERMSDGAVWCGVTLEDGRTVHVDVFTGQACRHKLIFRAEER